jgi:hypothetical protein
LEERAGQRSNPSVTGHQLKDGKLKMDEERAGGDVGGAITDAAKRLAHIAMRRGSPAATTTFGDGWVAVLVQGIDGHGQDTLFGSREEVAHVRGAIHRVMREDLVAKIERQLDRRVLAFIDQSSTDRDTVAYMYMLAPSGSPPVA